MIRVSKAPPPSDFDDRVGKPGRKFLTKTLMPTNRQFRNHNYWIRTKRDLHKSYFGICAYSCHYIPLDTGSDTVEHFVPKSKRPALAYVWDNYRLVCGRLNGRKGNNEDVLDPFELKNGMFALDFPSLLIKSGSSLNADQEEKVNRTIARLKLNDDETCIASRQEYVMSYCEQAITLEYLESKAPFVARELQRQGLVGKISKVMGSDINK